MSRPKPSVPSSPRLPLRARVVVLLSALLFLSAAWLSASGLIDCPHHDTSAHTTHAADSAGHAQDCAPLSGHDADHGTACTCVGLCHPTGQTPLPTVAPALVAAAEVAVHAPAPAAADAVLPAPPPYSFPYATAPPPFAA
jgi:hypothetical protein